MTPQLASQPDLTPHDRERMHALLNTHFDGVSRDQFDADIAGKNWAILLHGPAGELLGFTTFHLHQTLFHGRQRSVVYSGDTIVDPRGWGSSALSRAWIAGVWEAHARAGGGPLWWLLICSGYRTYRFLPVFWRHFFPRHETVTPAPLAAWRDELAAARFGRQYDPATGIVRFDRPQRLRGHLSSIPPGRMHDPHIDFFTRINPGHAAGDELVCLAELSRDNLTPAGARMAGIAAPVPETMEA